MDDGASGAAPEPGLFDGVLAAGGVRAATSDRAYLQAMLDAEAALAGALADAGAIPAGAAAAIAAACDAGRYDLAALGRDAAGAGNPVVPLVRALTAAVADADTADAADTAADAAAAVHLGATSQDVLDTATALVTARALGPLLADLGTAADRAAELAAEHRDTVQAGRTLLQQAAPVTFGLVAAGWTSGLDAAHRRLAEVRDTRLAVQLGGAAGTLASLGERGPAVLAAYAARLGLAEPALPWHTERTRVAEVAAALGGAAGAVGTVARDVTLLAQTEVAEVREEGPPGRGGSSTLPHKRNPVAAVAALGCAQQAPGLVATLLGAMVQEHQRAAGAWHAEWRPSADLLRTTGSAAWWLRESLARLRPDPVRMRAALDASGGVLLAERVTTELVPALGRLPAHEAVAAACRRQAAGEGDLADLLAADPVVGAHLSRDRLAALLDPVAYLGGAGTFVDRTLRARRVVP